jgi:hypothetical protein
MPDREYLSQTSLGDINVYTIGHQVWWKRKGTAELLDLNFTVKN